MNNNEIRDIIRKRMGKKGRRIRLPAAINFQEDGGNITIKMSGGTNKNMQSDEAAFEGWALGIKSAMNLSGNITLDWVTPQEQDIYQQHYQRFLYRVYKFNKFFGGEDGWFRVHKPERIKALRIDFHSKPRQYKLNVPSRERNSAKPLSGERLLEYFFMMEPRKSELMKAAGLEGGVLGNQLPVGVFEGKVAKGKNAIFTGGASAIDLWGVKDEKLCIFELKRPGNEKVGAISELFFYVMVMRDIVRGLFAFEGENKKKIAPWPPKHIRRGIETIEAIFLMEEMHPLITSGVLELMNSSLKGEGISFWRLSLQEYGWGKVEKE